MAQRQHVAVESPQAVGARFLSLGMMRGDIARNGAIRLARGEACIFFVGLPAIWTTNEGVIGQSFGARHAYFFTVVNEGGAGQEQIRGRSQFVVRFVAIDLVPHAFACKLIVIGREAGQGMGRLRVVLRHFLNGFCFTFGRFGNLIL